MNSRTSSNFRKQYKGLRWLHTGYGCKTQTCPDLGLSAWAMTFQ